ncbi:MAG: hypothetical protein E7442_06875 [Ruminococcaceae bacterium]|nr:hypothetical protein [Oscillospiraceae bacterium]
MKQRTRQGGGSVANGAAGGLFFAAVLLVFSLLGRMELTAVNAELSLVKDEIRLLEEENEKLQRGLVVYTDLEAAEKYALEELGLQRRQSGQIHYEEHTEADRVMILYVEGCDRFRRWWETCFR